MTEKKTLTEGHIRGQIKGNIGTKEIQNGQHKPTNSGGKPLGPPPAPTKKEK